MFTIFKRELSLFFNSLTGYIIIGTFLLMTGLFLWVLSGDWNIPMGGYAHLQGLFELAPWIFLFLVPAICMKMLAEEFKSGTMELLFTRPVSDLKIILAKYFAAVALIILALIPTLLYFYSVYQMGSPKGNLDSGAIWGSYIALMLLGASYASIGIFASSLTDNQIIAFIVALFISFFFYAAFDLIANIPGLQSQLKFVSYLGIENHYQSFSRGVVDSRDLAYFISVNLFFIFLTKWKIARR